MSYAIHTVLTDNGIQFTNMAHHKYAFHHIFDRVCDEHDIGIVSWAIYARSVAGPLILSHFCCGKAAAPPELNVDFF